MGNWLTNVDSFFLSQEMKIAFSVVRSAVALAVFFMQVPRGCYSDLSIAIYFCRYMGDVVFESLVFLSI